MLARLGHSFGSFFRYWGVALGAFTGDLLCTYILAIFGLEPRLNALLTGLIMTFALFVLHRTVVFRGLTAPWESHAIPFFIVSGMHILLSQAAITLFLQFVESGVDQLGAVAVRAMTLLALAILKFFIVSKFLFGGKDRLQAFGSQPKKEL